MSEPAARPTLAPEAPLPEAPRASAVQSIEPAAPSLAGHVRALTPHGTAKVIERAPWYVTVCALVIDLVVSGGLLLLLNGGKLRTAFAEGAALVILAGIAGVRVADYVRAFLKGGNPTHAGPAMIAFAVGSQLWHHGATWLRIASLSGLVLLAVNAAGCAAGPRSPNDTAQAVVKVATLARVTACDDTLDTWLGRTPPLQVDRAPETALEVVGQIRAWLCADALAGLLDTARELLTPPRRASSEPGDDASPRAARDPSPSAETDAGATAATDAEAPPASPGAPDDGGAPPTVASDPDAGPVTP